MAIKKFQAVEVDWVDSMNTSGWSGYERSDLRCRSVGMLVERTADRVVLSLQMHKKSLSVGHIIEIPASAVKRVKKLK